jgi:hypothetical protein
VRNAKAWGNAPGNIPTYPAALKARDEIKTVNANSGIPRPQRFKNTSRLTWAVGPGFHITRLWRLLQLNHRCLLKYVIAHSV